MFEAYQEFLDADRQLQSLMIPPTIADGAFGRWNVDFDHAFNSVLLLGTETSRAPVREFASVIPKKLPVAAEWPEIRDTYWSLFHNELEALRAAVLDAMRKDVLESQLQHHP